MSTAVSPRDNELRLLEASPFISTVAHPVRFSLMLTTHQALTVALVRHAIAMTANPFL